MNMEDKCKDDNSSPSKETDPSEDSGAAAPETSSSVKTDSPINIGNRSPTYVATSSLASSPPQFVTMDEIMSATNGLKNMQLAHEIAVDKDFKLSQYEPPENSLERVVKDAVHKAFWDLLAEELSSDPPIYTRAMIHLEEVKTMLLDLLYPQHEKLKEEISETLDIPLIQQQAENGALDFMGYAQYIIDVMGRLCAPARDEKIQELKQMTDVVQIFKGVFETLSLMRIDLANFSIQMVRSTLMAQSVEYEKAKFAEALALQGGLDSLIHTKKWLKRHYDGVRSGLYPEIMTSAYLELLEWNFDEHLPETVRMDSSRLKELGHQLYRIIISGSILLVAMSKIASPTLQSNTTIKEKLIRDVEVLLQDTHNNESLKSSLPNIAAHIVDALRKQTHNDTDLEPHVESEQIDTAFAQSLTDLIVDIQRPDHNVRRIVTQRVTEFLHLALSSLPSVPKQVPPGLTSLRSQLLSITGAIVQLYKYNQAVFGEYYFQILAKIKDENTLSTS